MFKSISFLILILITIFVTLHSQELTVLTENFPPYNYVENNKLTGFSIELINLILAETDYEYKIDMYSWARSYELTRNESNTLLISTSRQASREDLFKWVGPIVKPTYSIYALKDWQVEIDSLDELKNYHIGTTKNDARETYLISKGFIVGKNLDQVSTSNANNINLLKLLDQRIDFWPMPDAVAEYTCRSNGYNINDILKPVYKINELADEGYFIAINLNTSKEIVENLQSKLDLIKSDGRYDRLIEKWGLKQQSSN